MSGAAARWWLAFIGLWALGAALAARLGFWRGLGSVALVLGGLAFVADRTLWRKLYPVRIDALVRGGAVGLLMVVAARTLYPVVLPWVPWVASDSARLYTAFAVLTPLQAGLLMPLVILGEELVWRGVVHGALAVRLGPPAAVVLGSLLYGLATLPSGSPVLAATAFACGLGWSWLRMTTGGLLGPLLSHLIWAALVLFVNPIATH